MSLCTPAVALHCLSHSPTECTTCAKNEIHLVDRLSVNLRMWDRDLQTWDRFWMKSEVFFSKCCWPLATITQVWNLNDDRKMPSRWLEEPANAVCGRVAAADQRVLIPGVAGCNRHHLWREWASKSPPSSAEQPWECSPFGEVHWVTDRLASTVLSSSGV